ncbi:MAG: hypothetical protein JNG89_17420, partial [Planctomycetaceae bacterium]|nr:hypothetical protein [Planctomycetaceae bacterium]
AEPTPLEVESIRQQLSDAQSRWGREWGLRLLIQPGAESEAQAYYGRISTVLNFPFAGSRLDSLLSYMGYSVANGSGGFQGLLATDLEKIPSFTLMPRDAAEFAALKSAVIDGAAFDAQLDLADFLNDRVLVSRFFAPKIATYYDPDDEFDPIDPETIIPGWRKLVRLTSRTGSPAATAGIQHMYLLFNVKQADPDVDPFKVESANNQVILVPRNQDAGDSAYFAVYGAGSVGAGYELSFFLAADFDLPGHVGVTVPGGQDGRYFVPRSCAECHGHSGGALGLQGQPVDAAGAPTQDFATGIYPFAKPNYLDTDQWYDWMEFDFAGVATSLNDVVFDGGKNHGSANYTRAMGVMIALNSTIRNQTFAAEPDEGVATYQTLAAEKWLSLHAVNLQRVPYSQRSIGAESWNPDSPDEMRLLRLLVNHCFRCHSSLRYNVFDRERVGQLHRRGTIKDFLTLKIYDPNNNNNPVPGFTMPQGRVLEASERDEIIRLLNTVFP